MKSIVIICAVLCSYAVAADFGKLGISPLKDIKGGVDPRIINGNPAKVKQFPWQVAIYAEVQGGVFFCGGALIYDEWILTAAHCADNVKEFTIILGSLSSNPQIEETNRVVEKTTEKHVHEKYDQKNLNNDIALIKLKNKVKLTDYIQTIALADSRIGDAAPVSVSGWGKTSDSASGTISPVLRYTNLTTISNEACEKIYQPGLVISETLCAKGGTTESTCQGDSGGPLISINDKGEHIHTAIVSFVASTGCTGGYPSGYVRTASYSDWIAKKTGRDTGGGAQGIHYTYSIHIALLLVLKYIF